MAVCNICILISQQGLLLLLVSPPNVSSDKTKERDFLWGSTKAFTEHSQGDSMHPEAGHKPSSTEERRESTAHDWP